MSVFPNPSAGIATVSYQVADAAQAVAVRITDLLGRAVRDARQNSDFQNPAVAITDLSLGTYPVMERMDDKVASHRLAVSR